MAVRRSLAVLLGALVGGASGVGLVAIAFLLSTFTLDWLHPAPAHLGQESYLYNLGHGILFMVVALALTPVAAVLGGVLGAARVAERPAPAAGPDNWTVPDAGQVADIINHPPTSE
jgi:hypothetical protein